MSTFGTMIDRIGTETRRSALSANIQDAIKSAIKHYEADVFWFNEERATATAITSQEWYALPTGFKEIYNIQYTVSGNEYTLEERSHQEMERLYDSSWESDPHYYNIFDGQLRLQPIPSQTAVMCMSYAKELTAVSATSDTNAWFVEGEPLIRAKAKEYFFRDTLHNSERAAEYNIVSQQEEIRLKQRSRRYAGTGEVDPWL